MVGDCERPIDDLRWHWGDAYLIHCFGPGQWVAQRRDSHATMSAEGPEELRTLIVADYTAHPVSRATDSAAADPRPCRFLPEG
jgi:hypothetical protein